MKKPKGKTFKVDMLNTDMVQGTIDACRKAGKALKVLHADRIDDMLRSSPKKVSTPCIEIPSFINVRLLGIENLVNDLMTTSHFMNDASKENLYSRIQDIRKKLKAIQYQQFYTPRPTTADRFKE